MGKINQKEISTKPSEVPVAKNTALKDETRITKSAAVSSPRGSPIESHVRTVSVSNEHPALIQNLDEQINTFMSKSSRKNKLGQRFYVCNVCGKEDINGHLKVHIEVNHLEGISVPCNFCEKMFRSRSAKAKHISRYHKGHQDLV